MTAQEERPGPAGSRGAGQARGAGTARMSGWSELAIGLRLAVGGGRTSWMRFALTAFGIGLCTVVLLFAASVGPAVDARTARAHAVTPLTLSPDGAAPMTAEPLPLPETRKLRAGEFVAHDSSIPFGGQTATGWDLAAADPTATPLPLGVQRFPVSGELVVAPAVADLLASTDGATLRRQLPGLVIGTIGPEGLLAPDELRFYRGALVPDQPVQGYEIAVGWGSSGGAPDPLGLYLTVLLTAGTAIIVAPLLIFVSLVARIGGVTRDRSMAAMALIGASRAQLSRVSMVETALAAMMGVLLGGTGYLLLRPLIAGLRIGPTGFFSGDLSPSVAAAIAVIVVMPLMAIIAVWTGTRRALVQPLAMGHGGPRKPRRLWWRLAILATGFLVMLGTWFSGFAYDMVGLARPSTYLLATAVVLMLISVPLLLPWLFERLAGRLPTSGVAWQLAVRRLQADPGGASRVVAGVSVVLAGAIALQSLLALSTIPGMMGARSGTPSDYRIYVQSPSVADLMTVADAVNTLDVTAIIGGAPLGGTVLAPGETVQSALERAKSNPFGTAISVVVTPCAGIRVSGCRDGDVYRVSNEKGSPAPTASSANATPAIPLTTNPVPTAPVEASLVAGATVLFGNAPDTGINWTIPTIVGTVPNTFFGVVQPDLVVTPAALGNSADELFLHTNLDLRIITGESSAFTAQELRTILAGMTWRATVEAAAEGGVTGNRAGLRPTAETGVLLAAVLTLIVAALGLIVTAMEQLAQRRRSLTLAVAAGTPRSVITRSLILGASIPLVAGVVLAVIIGSGLAMFLADLFGGPGGLDWGVVVGFSGLTILAVMATTVAVLPLVDRYTRLEDLRTG